MWFTKIISKEESMIGKLLEFFKTEANFDILYELLKNEKSRKNKMSLRLINWFVTNYAKHYTIRYKNNTNICDGITTLASLFIPSQTNFLVWIEYEKELASEGKEYFDAFRRGANIGKLIELEFSSEKKLQTTIAQLNFFRWAIRNNIITYIAQNVNVIYKDMIDRNSNIKNRVQNPDGSIKKRQLSVCISKKLGHHDNIASSSIPIPMPMPIPISSSIPMPMPISSSMSIPISTNAPALAIKLSINTNKGEMSVIL
jgi:hypothetical protein